MRRDSHKLIHTNHTLKTMAIVAVKLMKISMTVMPTVSRLIQINSYAKMIVKIVINVSHVDGRNDMLGISPIGARKEKAR